MLSGPGSARGIAVVDVEMSGRSPWRHRVVEVGVVLLDHASLRVRAEFSTLIDPAGPVGPTEVHRIAQRHVVGAPAFREIAPFLLELLGGRLLVGHQVRSDLAFLVREFARIGVVLPAAPSLCTMALAGRVLPGGTGHSLRDCVAAVGLPPHAAHTALGDARATAALLRRCLRGSDADLAGAVAAAATVPWPRLPPADRPLRTLQRTAAARLRADGPLGVLTGRA
ncbi:exonuclease domain-containing protein [Streptacidiphilus sp. EB129]|uniref:3'-5' exonuclease n=1 Tax=Streptacidiphilus sp. EB129 TaxID=3156262 RepID=UPI00351262A9